MSISIKNITKVFGEQRALDDVSFDIQPGEVVGLLGPNGAGKSTLMKIITCFIPPTSGIASVCGYDIYDHSLEVRARVGYLPENNPLYLEMYVKEYLDFIAGIHGFGKTARKRTEKMIEITGLGAEQKKKIGALSKGYRQRVGLAQALIHDPDVLILDEPTAGLDPNQLVDIRNLIKEVGKAKTVMLSTHIMQEAEAICGRSVIINKGKIVADDKTENLSHASANKDYITVEFDKTIDTKRIAGIVGIVGIVKLEGNTYLIETKPGKDIRPEIFRFAVENGHTVLSMAKKEQRLEEVFKSLTSDPAID
jgi:ABC-2 type transport system ATP-binding protein